MLLDIAPTGFKPTYSYEKYLQRLSFHHIPALVKKGLQIFVSGVA
jgi:hypothetical protein